MAVELIDKAAKRIERRFIEMATESGKDWVKMIEDLFHFVTPEEGNLLGIEILKEAQPTVSTAFRITKGFVSNTLTAVATEEEVVKFSNRNLFLQIVADSRTLPDEIKRRFYIFWLSRFPSFVRKFDIRPPSVRTKDLVSGSETEDTEDYQIPKALIDEQLEYQQETRRKGRSQRQSG